MNPIAIGSLTIIAVTCFSSLEDGAFRMTEQSSSLMAWSSIVALISPFIMPIVKKLWAKFLGGASDPTDIMGVLIKFATGTMSITDIIALFSDKKSFETLFGSLGTPKYAYFVISWGENKTFPIVYGTLPEKLPIPKAPEPNKAPPAPPK